MENTENVVQSNVAVVMQSFLGTTVDACANMSPQDRILAVRMRLFGIQSNVQESDMPDKAYSA
jgi:hypothetical protein